MPKAETAAEIEDDPHRLASRRSDDGDMDAKYVHRDQQAGLGEGLHFLGGISIDLAGNRAISQTKMTISRWAEVEGVLCHVYDFLEKREGKWGIVLRQPIYKKDRMDGEIRSNIH